MGTMGGTGRGSQRALCGLLQKLLPLFSPGPARTLLGRGRMRGGSALCGAEGGGADKHHENKDQGCQISGGGRDEGGAFRALLRAKTLGHDSPASNLTPETGPIRVSRVEAT